LANDVVIFYAPPEMYEDGGLTVMEMVCASTSDDFLLMRRTTSRLQWFVMKDEQHGRLWKNEFPFMHLRRHLRWLRK
jgi:hypothetical protein